MQMKTGFTRNSDILMKIYEEFLAYNPEMQREMVTKMLFYDFFSLRTIQKTVPSP